MEVACQARPNTAATASKMASESFGSSTARERTSAPTRKPVTHSLRVCFRSYLSSSLKLGCSQCETDQIFQSPRCICIRRV